MTPEIENKVIDLFQSNLSDRACRDFLNKRHLTSDFLCLTNAGYINKHLADSSLRKSTQTELALLKEGQFRYQSHLVFPCYSFDGSFCGFIGRATFDTPFKFHLPEHVLFSKETYIHGFSQVDESSKFCFVTENMFEWGRILQCGFPAVSLNGAYKSKFKLSVLANRFDKLIVVADNDQAGFGLKDFIKQYLGDLNRQVSFVEHKEKGLDEFFVAYGKQATTELLSKYI